MSTAMVKNIPKTIALTTTGTLLTGVEEPQKLRIASADGTGTNVVYVELGALVDGGSVVAARSEPYLISAIPVEITIGHAGPIKLVGGGSFSITATVQ